MTYNTGDMLLKKYRVQRLLGRGAFAEVYLAEHLQLNAPRALKVLRKDAPGLGSSEYQGYRERFQLEAQLGARLNHANLVQVHDFEQAGDTLILVMEYCPGGCLASRMSSARSQGEGLSLDFALSLAKDLACGLSILHQLDLVHRDIKPSNILFGSNEQWKIGDLGLVQTPGGLSQRSLLGSLSPRHPGTPGYMSPEQEKTTDYLRSTSDVYTLGVVLFEVLTGRNYNNLKPGTRLSSLVSGTPGWWDELLARMLQKDPEQRPWNGGEVLGFLEQGMREEADRQQVEKEWSAAAHRAALEAEARRQLEAEQKARWELEKKEAVQRAQQDAEQKAQREAETRRQQIPAKKHHVAHNQSSENSPLQDKRERDIFRSPVLWIGIVLVGLVIFGLAAIGLINLLAPDPSSQVQANATAIIKDTTAAVTDLPTRAVMNTAPPTPSATRTQRPTASPTPTENLKLPPAQAALGDTWTSRVDGMELVYIPAGEFQMGCDPAHNGGYDCYQDELPLHTVTLDAYYIDKTEVTNAQYEKCVADGECEPPNETSSYSQSAYYGKTSYDNHPVINVSWQDASKYCEWAGRELPTEAQWEKAARGKSPRAYPWGDTEPTCELVNGTNCVGDTTAVGSYPLGASPYGVLDMVGNVWEWVRDWYSETYYSSLERFINPVGPSTGTYKVIRGGCFSYNDYYLRTAYRAGYKPGYWGYFFGFRCADSPAP